jgi:hypothetical protein
MTAQQTKENRHKSSKTTRCYVKDTVLDIDGAQDHDRASVVSLGSIRALTIPCNPLATRTEAIPTLIWATGMHKDQHDQRA